MNRKQVFIIALIIYLAGALSNFVFLSGTPIFYAIFNFAFFLFLMIWGGKDHISAYFQSRANHWTQTLNRCRQDHALAEETLQKTQADTAQLISQKPQLLQQALNNAQNAARLVIDQAVHLKTQMLADAKQSAEQEFLRVRRQLKSQAAQRAVALARLKLLKTVTPQIHQKLADEFIYKLKEGGLS